MDGLGRKKSMFSSKVDGYFQDVILIFSRSDIFHGVKFSRPAEALHGVKNYIHAVVYFTIE